MTKDLNPISLGTINTACVFAQADAWSRYRRDSDVWQEGGDRV